MSREITNRVAHPTDEVIEAYMSDGYAVDGTVNQGYGWEKCGACDYTEPDFMHIYDDMTATVFYL